MMCGVPRVSDEHLAARRQQILDAARRCFLRNGLRDTSMQDLIAEADLSVGAVYRYFKSKNDIVSAIADGVIGSVGVVFAEIATHEPPYPLTEAIDRALQTIEKELGPDGAFRLALQVWAQAVLDPALAEIIAGKYAIMRTHFATIARQARDRGELPPDTDVDAVATVLFGSVAGYAVQRVLTGIPDRPTYRAGLRALLAGQPVEA